MWIQDVGVALAAWHDDSLGWMADSRSLSLPPPRLLPSAFDLSAFTGTAPIGGVYLEYHSFVKRYHIVTSTPPFALVISPKLAQRRAKYIQRTEVNQLRL
jgi:hypothetical protein